ncbi:MAG TPA: KH domain-containing protein [Methanothrix sp.]|jgi:ribosomal RNA assembly protein|nr:KH domain-containing protein [Methanothrix sp.]HPC89025.1 KH domain-containing protein [Methanothrix sp.]HQE86790.1 KH domain-containing protein [Methanothrix sp.]HQI67419.1 KH domain-containing protein [Methanothrix sp.]HRS85014.1 KH domain-containing protein [Methanothrix sp.]
MIELDIKIPEERIGVLVGPGGSMKRLIEEKTKTTLEIDSETGTISIASPEDPLQGLRVLDLVKAIGRGFSPERALCILDDEMLMLDILDLSKILGTKSDMARVKGRIIGKDGRSRVIMERLSGAKVSVYGKTVALLGYPQQIRVARAAIEMLLDGAPHGNVYSFLEKKHQELAKEELKEQGIL